MKKQHLGKRVMAFVAVLTMALGLLAIPNGTASADTTSKLAGREITAERLFSTNWEDSEEDYFIDGDWNSPAMDDWGVPSYGLVLPGRAEGTYGFVFSDGTYAIINTDGNDDFEDDYKVYGDLWAWVREHGIPPAIRMTIANNTTHVLYIEVSLWDEEIGEGVLKHSTYINADGSYVSGYENWLEVPPAGRNPELESKEGYIALEKDAALTEQYKDEYESVFRLDERLLVLDGKLYDTDAKAFLDYKLSERWYSEETGCPSLMGEVGKYYYVESTINSGVFYKLTYDTSVQVEDGKVDFTETTTPVAKEDFASVLEANKTQDIVIATNNSISFTFGKGTMQAVDTVESYNFATTVVNTYDAKMPEYITKDNFVTKIDFAYSGKLPAEAQIAIPVGTQYAGKTLYYSLMKDDGTFAETQSAVVSAEGVMVVKQNHCSSYVITTEAPVVKEDVKPENKPVQPGMGDMTSTVSLVVLFGAVLVAAGFVAKKKTV